MYCSGRRVTVSSLEPILKLHGFKLGHFLALAGVDVLIGKMNDGFDRLEPLTSRLGEETRWKECQQC